MTSLLLLSGGIDSTSIAYAYRPSICLTIDYGQRAAVGENRAAAAVCNELAIRHESIKLDWSVLGCGTMAGKPRSEHSEHEEWWPFRNQLLITAGAAIAIKYGLTTILIGTVSSDVRHGDGSRHFVESISELLRLQEGGISLSAPAIDMTSELLVMSSGIPNEILAFAHSCHVSGWACGQCNGCIKHSRVMRSVGMSR